MAIKGHTIVNRVTSDVITFIQTRDDTNGTLLQFDNRHDERGIGPVPHRHPLQEETFIVKKGILSITIADRKFTLHAGEKAIVPPDTMHYWSNGGQGELHLLTEFRPALHFEEIIETIATLSQQGKVDEHGNPSPVQMSATLNAYYGEFFLGTMPVPIQVFMFRFFGWVLRKIFRYPDYLKYNNRQRSEASPIRADYRTP